MARQWQWTAILITRISKGSDFAVVRTAASVAEWKTGEEKIGVLMHAVLRILIRWQREYRLAQLAHNNNTKNGAGMCSSPHPKTDPSNPRRHCKLEIYRRWWFFSEIWGLVQRGWEKVPTTTKWIISSRSISQDHHLSWQYGHEMEFEQCTRRISSMSTDKQASEEEVLRVQIRVLHKLRSTMHV